MGVVRSSAGWAVVSMSPFIAALALAGCPTNQPSSLRDLTAVDHVLSVGEPAVTVIAYEDLQCPVCGRFERETFPTIRAEYIDTGKVRWVFRHFPLRSVHANAEAAAEAAECAADQGLFFEFTEAVFADQSDLSAAGLRERALAAGLDSAAYDASDPAAKAERVQTDVDSGAALGVSGTPTFFVNGSPVVGYRTVDQMRALLDLALAGN